ncbi:MAG: AI-2E family transporter, partial [Nocardioides sp.]
NGANDLADSTARGLGEIKDWLKNGPLNASDSQINDYLQQAQDAITEQSRDGAALAQLTEVGTTIGHVLAGFFIILFSTYFFLADGDRIWAWLVRLSPRAARAKVDSSGRVAWISLTQFVRATVIVALVDAIGITVGAAILGVPFVLAIGVLVFLGSFIPLVGATVAGSVAILVALVDQGPITALLMLAVVIGVQQVEGHVLQPFLMGRWVSLHPLGVIFAIGAGVIVAGIAGALVAVPLAAALNAVVQHLAANTDPGDDALEELAEDYEEAGEVDVSDLDEDELADGRP